MSHTDGETCLGVVRSTRAGHSQRCSNPCCQAVIEPLRGGRWRRTKRLYCNDECNRDHRALVRARAMKDRVGVVRFFELMETA
jgi:hypothetical protein